MNIHSFQSIGKLGGPIHAIETGGPKSHYPNIYGAKIAIRGVLGTHSSTHFLTHFI